MDEVDLILHPLRSELNFPIGPKLDLDFSPLRWRLPIHLMDAIFYAETGRISVDFQNSEDALSLLWSLKQIILNGYKQRNLQRNPHIVLLDVNYYHNHMRPVLIEWVLFWLNQQHFSGLSQDQVTIFYLNPYSSLTFSSQKRSEPIYVDQEKQIKFWLKELVNGVL
jgi:hypothetical protein